MTHVMRGTEDQAVQLLKKANGRYVVVAAGKTIVETGVLTAAEIYYEEEVQKLKPPPAWNTGEPHRTGGKSFWQRILSMFSWLHEETAQGADPTKSREHPHHLVVNFDAGKWPVSGVLSQMGYHVGKSGLDTPARRLILQGVFEVRLVSTSAETESYISEWGSPRSEKRAQKIEACLAGFSSGARRRSADMSGAIADWESDLAWVRNNYHL